MKKAFVLFLLGLVGALCIGEASAQDKKFRVGVSLPEAQNPFYVAMGKSIADTFKQRGVEANVLSANADVNEQVNTINDLIAAKVDAILLSPLDQEGPAPAVERANKAGIHVFMIARTLDQRYRPLWKSFVGIDLTKVGRMKGEWLVANSKPGKVAMLLGPAGALFSVEQERGFRAVVEPVGYRVAWAQNSTQTRENGLKLAEDALVAHNDLIAIYGANDDLALGAAQAVKAAGASGRVAVLGTNGSPPALAAIHKGDMAMSIVLDPVAWGMLGANTVTDFLTSGKLEHEFVALEPKVATSANAYDLIPPGLRDRLGVKPKG
jgi:ribose transport system substrate-binding protein